MSRSVFVNFAISLFVGFLPMQAAYAADEKVPPAAVAPAAPTPPPPPAPAPPPPPPPAPPAQVDKTRPQQGGKDLTKAERQKLGDVYAKMASCIRSDKPMKECKKEMKMSCKSQVGKGCGMGRRGHHKGHGMKKGAGAAADHDDDDEDDE